MSQVIWTRHLRERIVQRGLNPHDIESAIHFPDTVKSSQTSGSQKHFKAINGYTVVAAVKKIGNDWLVTSAWQEGRSTYSKNKSWWLERVIYRTISSLEKFFRRRI